MLHVQPHELAVGRCAQRGKTALHIPTAHLVRPAVVQPAHAGGDQLGTTDHAADLLLAPTLTAMDNLAVEGPAQRSVLLVTSWRMCGWGRRWLTRPLELCGERLVGGCCRLATLYGQENADDEQRLAALVAAL